MATGKDIIEKQNEDEQQKLLAAQRQLYSEEKVSLGLQMTIAIGVALIGSFLQSTYPQTAPYVVIAGAVVALADVLWLESQKGKKQRLAAKIQERFDCTVLQMDWRELKTGSKPEPEDILDKSEKIMRNKEQRDSLINWYPAEIEDLPLQPARIICQRINCMYDSRLREKYILGLKISLALLTIAAFIIAVVQNQNFVQSIALIIAPLIPAYVITFREIFAQADALELAQLLKDHGNELWDAALLKTATESQLDTTSRFLQDEIYDSRRRSALIFDWIYNTLRDKNEKTLSASTQQFVNDYKSRNG